MDTPCRWQLDASTQQAQLLEEQLAQHLKHGWTDREACKSFMDGALKFCRDNKLFLSSRLVASTAAYLTQQQWWGILNDLLRAQAPPSLAMCPGLSLAMIQGGQFALLASILPKVLPVFFIITKRHWYLMFVSSPLRALLTELISSLS